VAGGVGILRLHRRVQGLDRVERAALERVIRLLQRGRVLLEHARLAAKRVGGLAREQRERGAQAEEDEPDDEPDLVAPGRDCLLEWPGVRVDLEGPDDHLAVVGADRRVDLERALDARPQLAGVLRLASEVLEFRLAVALQRLGQVVLDGVAPADARGVGVRPGQHAVGPPDLDTENVLASVQARQDVLGRRARLGKPVAVHQVPAQHAVHVCGERGLAILHGLVADRGGHERAQHESAAAKDERRQDDEKSQEGGRPRDPLEHPVCYRQ
jgi:hypothetical protein